MPGIITGNYGQALFQKAPIIILFA